MKNLLYIICLCFVFGIVGCKKDDPTCIEILSYAQDYVVCTKCFSDNDELSRYFENCGFISDPEQKCNCN